MSEYKTPAKPGNLGRHFDDNETRFQYLVEQISDWIWEVDTNGILTYVSPKVRDLLGYEPDQVIGRSVFELMPSAEAQRTRMTYEELVTEHEPFYKMVSVNQHHDGQLVILESSGIPLFDEVGNWIGYRAIGRDVSERHQQGHSISNAVIENTGALVVVLDEAGRIRRFNRTCEEVTYYRAEEVLGRYVWDFLLLPEEIDDVKDVFQNLQFISSLNEFTNYWIAKDKSLHLINWSNVAVKKENGKLDYLISIGVDITEQNIVQRTLAERSDLLERIFENTHTLIAYMDTDFNFIRVNQAYAKIENKTEEYFTGRNHFDLYPNRENEEIFRRVVESGETYFSYAKPFEYEYSPEKGITHWDWSLSAIKDDQGNVVALLLVLADVTKCVRAQQELLRNEDTMKTAQSIAHFGSWDWDILTGELVWSDEIYRIFGQQPQAFPATYDAFLSTIHPDDRDEVLNAVNASVKDAGVRYDVEHRIVRPKDEIRYVHEMGEVYRDENGRPIRMIGTVHDITDRKLSEQEMHIKDLAIQRSISAISMADLDANITYVNQAFLDIWGYTTREEVLGRSVIEFWKNPQQIEAMIEELTSVGQWIGEMDAISRHGEYMCIRVSANITYDEAGKPLNMMASFVDVSEQHAIQSSLRLSQELLSKAQEIAHVGSWHWDIMSGKLTWSDETYRIFGRDRDSFSEKYEDFLGCVHMDDREMVDLCIKSCLSDPEKTYRVEHRVIHPDGNVRVVLEQGVIYRNESDKPTYMVGSVLDITERKQIIDELESYRAHLEQLVKERTSELEETVGLLKIENDHRKLIEQSLIEAKEEAEYANKLKSEFLGRVSHELRTPMNAILGFGQLMEEETLNDEQKNYMQEIMHASRHLMGLIDEVLDLAKVETGNIDIRLGTIPVCEVVLESLALMSYQADAADIKIENQVEHGPWRVRADRIRLKEILVNLLTNAVKYNRPHGSITVAVTTSQESNLLRIQVTDTGQGIPPEQQAMIFEPFNRLGAEYTEIEGTGIGLTISKQLIELMGGKIGVDSVLGQGSTFWIELPAGSSSDETPRQPPVPGEACTETAAEKTILYVEDNPANMRLMQSVVERRPNWQLLTAVNAEQGIELARAKRPDLVILDLQLPGMNGYEALIRLKSYPETKGLKYLALSAAAMPGDIEKGLLAGFKRYLTKPIQLSDLREILTQELEDGEYMNDSPTSS